MPMTRLLSLAITFLVLCTCATAGQRTFALTNWVECDWPRMLLNYDLTCAPGEFFPNKVEVINPAGTAVPSQVQVLAQHDDGSIKSCRLSFYAALPKDDTLTYTLRSADKPTLFTPGVTAKVKAGVLEVASNIAGVRLPAPGGKSLKQPMAPSAIPAPILGYRLSTGQWAGKGWLESDRQVASWSQAVVADGPLYKEYAYEVRFVPEGYYKVRVRVEAEDPLVYVAEEYDMHRATAGKDLFVFTLNDGWRPDTVLWSSKALPAGKQILVRKNRVENDTSLWKEALDFTADRRHTQLFPTGDWGSKTQWYGLFQEAGDAASPFVGVMTMHTGAWRLPDQSLSDIVWTKDGKVRVKFRTSIHLNGAPQNPFSTAEIDPSLPQTLGRRMWALVLGPRPAMMKDGKTIDFTKLDGYRGYQGFINLDRYKDWLLTWKAKDVPGPRIYGTPASIARLKETLDRCPGKDQIKDFSLLTGDLKTAIAEAERAIRAIDHRMGRALPYFGSHYRQTQWDAEPTFYADSALACKDLPADLRRKLLAKVAAACYLLSDADFIPRGVGTHMGNPNMAINRYMGLPLYATLISNHPRAKAWLDDAYVYTKWKTSYNVASAGGTFRECPGYTTYGPSLFIGVAAIALRNAGYDIDRFAPLKEWGQYFEAIDTPPTTPRGFQRPWMTEWLGNRKVRVLPGFGNGADIAGGQFYLLLAHLTAKSDPAFAARMMADWQEAGAAQSCTDSAAPFYWFFWNPDITPAPVKRTDHLLTGFGGILRDHADSPEETYVALRQGYTQSHWNPDQGTFVLYARGACLAPPTGWGYSGTSEGIHHDSLISFGVPIAKHEHGRVDTNIEDYGFTTSVGYLLGRQTFKQRWDPTKTTVDGNTVYTLKGDFDWSRQVVMLRSGKVATPTYVVVRDSTQGDCPLPSWWYQWLSASKENVTPIPGGVHVDAADGVKLNVTFVEPANPQITVKGTKVPNYQEDYSQISVSQGPNQGYLTVFYPYQEGEPLPQKIERLGEGIVKVTTAESTDYVFCAVVRPVVYRDDLVNINAFAGAVRIYADQVVLVNASGLRGSVSYKGVTATGIGPFERVVAVNPAKAETIQAGRRPVESVDTRLFDGQTRPGIEGRIHDVEPDGRQFIAVEGNGRIGQDDFYVIGEAPFTVTHNPGKITINVPGGRRRILQMPIPEDIVPAHLLPSKDSQPEDFKLNWSVGGWINWPWAVDVKVDGISYQGGWYDGLMTVGVPEGKHTIEITPYTNPPVWKENAYTRLLPVK